jgi:hypothetical protein
MDGIKHADKQCRKLNMGGIPFSLEFKKMDATVGLWNALIHRKSGKRVSSRFLQRMLKKAGIPDRLSSFSALTKEEIIAKRKVAYQDYRTFFKQHSTTARVTWLEDLAEARAAEELKRKNQETKGIRRRSFTKLKKGQTLLSKATDTELRQLRDRERLRTIGIASTVSTQNLLRPSIGTPALRRCPNFLSENGGGY